MSEPTPVPEKNAGDALQEAPAPAQAEREAPPPVAESENPEPAVVALVFLLPPLALGGTALGLLLAGGYGWNPLGVGLILGLIASVVGFAVIRRIFDAG